MHRLRFGLLLCLLMLLNPAAVLAAEPGASGIFRSEGWQFSVYAGRYDVAEEPQFVGIRNKYGLGVGMSAGFQRYPNLALDLELLFVNRDYNTPLGPPLWGTIDNDTSVQTTAFLAGVRAFYPANASINAYVSAGLGIFHTRMVVSGSLLGFPGLYEDRDTSLDPYYGVGASFTFGNWGLSLDLRHFDIKGNFSAFNISNANLGGDLLLVGWHYRY